MATLKKSTRQGSGVDTAGETQDFVTMTIAGQLFGIPVLTVQDILGQQKITRIPLAPPEVAGSLNLRGRIVTAVDVRLRLGLAPRGEGEQASISCATSGRWTAGRTRWSCSAPPRTTSPISARRSGPAPTNTS